MQIKIIENKIDEIDDINYRNIIQFIIEAVKDYPIYNLDDTEDYFTELKNKFNSSDIDLQVLETELKKSYKDRDENAIWVQTSLSSLTEAFELMKIHKIDFQDVLNKIKSL